MDPVDGEIHEKIVKDVLRQMKEIGCIDATESDVGCHYAYLANDYFVISSRSASCDEQSPVICEIVVQPAYMTDNMDTIGKAFATLPKMVAAAIQNIRAENSDGEQLFSSRNNKTPALLN